MIATLRIVTIRMGIQIAIEIRNNVTAAATKGGHKSHVQHHNKHHLLTTRNRLIMSLLKMLQETTNNRKPIMLLPKEEDRILLITIEGQNHLRLIIAATIQHMGIPWNPKTYNTKCPHPLYLICNLSYFCWQIFYKRKILYVIKKILKVN